MELLSSSCKYHLSLKSLSEESDVAAAFHCSVLVRTSSVLENSGSEDDIASGTSVILAALGKIHVPQRCHPLCHHEYSLRRLSQRLLYGMSLIWK